MPSLCSTWPSSLAATPWRDPGQYEALIRPFLLDPFAPEIHQFFTSMFLHGNWMHILGNMIFLWVFGNAVNDRFGHVGYAAFYLAGGWLSGHGLRAVGRQAPVLGASGAISAVTGAYLVLFPRVRVTVSGLLFRHDPASRSPACTSWASSSPSTCGPAGGSGGGVAYAAHATGYVFGSRSARPAGPGHAAAGCV